MYKEIDENILLLSPKFLRQKEYWLNKLSGDLEEIQFLIDHRRLKSQNTVERMEVIIPDHLCRKIMKLGKNSDLSIYIILLAGLNTLIYRSTFIEDITVLSPIYKLNISQDTINYFLGIRTRVEGDMTFKDLIIQIKDSVVEAYKNQDYPFKKILEFLSTSTRLKESDNRCISNIECTLKNIHKDIKMDDIKGKLSFSFLREESCLKGYLLYNPGIYKEHDLKQVLKHFFRILAKGIENVNVRLSRILLLSAEEKKQLLIDFNNTKTDFSGDKKIHQFIENHAMITPDRIAVGCGSKEMTYREIDKKAKVLARLIREVEIASEHPLGILSDRSNLLVEGILGVWKAGGAYIPIDPGYPIKRILAILKDSQAEVLIADSQYINPGLDQGYNGKIIRLEGIHHRTGDEEICGADVDLGININSLAYVIYTSGSTGKPKGVMVEHSGMMNHIQSKINTLGISKNSIIAQNASHTFDISVWQLFAGPIRQGKTVIYPNQVIMDPHRFLTDIEKDQINILEVVPSYLSIMLDSLELKFRKFEALHYLLVTGEELKPNLVTQWFEKYPGIKMVNAYGPTEASDDITHHMMDESLDIDQVPIGKPIRNLNIYIVDKFMNLLPLGVRGEICVSGIGVGRGYLNDAEKTSQVFMEDPWADEKRGGKKKIRLYKTGDLGCWHPDGTIDFFRRIDTQLKIRGYRIELGEIESMLVNYPGIKDAAVIALEANRESANNDSQEDKYLYAYLLTEDKVNHLELRNHLLEELPEYMLPVDFVELEHFPLTANGKVDRKALAKIEVKKEKKYIAPKNEIESKLVEVFKSVLGRNTIGIDENFFMIGGDSIKSIQIASRLHKIGYKVKMRDIFQNPTIMDLAPLVKKVEYVLDQSLVTGIVPLLPIQKEFFIRPRIHQNHYNQAVMLFREEGFEEELMKTVFTRLSGHHDALRMTYKKKVAGEIVQINKGLDCPLSFLVYDFRHQSDKKLAHDALQTKVDEIQGSIDLEAGPLMKTALFKFNDGDRLLIVIHHLVIDGVSWRILFEDIENLYNQLKENKGKKHVELPLKTDSYKTWAEKLSQYANTGLFLEEKTYWAEIESAVIPRIDKDFEVEDKPIKDAADMSFVLTREETNLLLTKVNNAYGTEINDILLCALGLSLREVYGFKRMLISLEAHGREEIFKDIDINRTVGWFTSIYPVILDMSHEHDLSRQIKEVKEILHRVPNGGIGYGILKYLTAEEYKKQIAFQLNPQVSFNYLGQFDRDVEQKSFIIAGESFGNTISKEEDMTYELQINGIIKGGSLVMYIAYNRRQFRPETMQRLLGRYHKELSRVISHCAAREEPELTPSDLTYPKLAIETLEQLKKNYPIKDIYVLSPMQEGMLFHALFERNTSTYFEQLSYRLYGHLDIPLVERSVNELLKRYDVLRTVFIYEGMERPLQVVLKVRTLDLIYEDIRETIGEQRRYEKKEAYVKAFKEKDRAHAFDLSTDLLMRVSVLQLGESEYEFTWSFHHILMDGWCVGILVAEFSEIYRSFIENRSYRLPAVKPYRVYIQWLEKQDEGEARNYWRLRLEHYQELAGLPRTKQAATVLPGYKNQRVTVKLKQEKAAKLTELAGRNQVTLSTIFQGVWGVLLSKYCGKQDVAFGVVVSGRPAEIAGVESMVGLFINTVPVRIQHNDRTTFKRLLDKVQEDAVNREPHQHYPLSLIQADSELKHNLLDHILIYENYPIAEQIDGIMKKEEKNPNPAAASLKIAKLNVFEQTNYDFNVVIMPGNQEIIINLDFNENVYAKEFVERIACHFNGLINHVLDNEEQYVDEFTLLSKEEKNQLLVEFNDTQAQYPLDKTIHFLLADQVEKTPDHAAIMHNDSELTYRQLNEKATQLARLLQEKNLKPGAIAAIMAERSADMIIGILAVLKTGAAYLPIDPGYPIPRILFMLSDSSAEILVTTRQLSHDLNFAKEIVYIPSTSQDVSSAGLLYSLTASYSNLAYVIYTSGSTGKPKGVMIEHQGLVNYIYWGIKNYVREERLNFPLYTSISFDLTVTSLFIPLLSGNAVVVYGEENNELLLEKVINENRVEVVKLTPSHLKAIRDKKIELTHSNIKKLIVGGEELETGLALDILKIFNGDIDIFNEYGPTETVVGTMIYQFNPETDADYSVPIGVPISNTQIFILDRKQRPVPFGVLGELCVSGDNIARGYLGQVELTAEKFIENPYIIGKTLYRTGDLARYLPGGDIHFAGRIDTQVKIRGFRVELGEIESLLLKRNEIKTTIVLDREVKSGDTAICAYIVYEPGRELTVPQLRDYLSEQLPHYMIPGYFVKLEKLPLTPNGKVDRNRLPPPGIKPGENYVEPETHYEKIITQIWKEVLGLDKVGIHDNFFDLGGNSLLSIRIVGRFKEVFKRNIPIVTMYRYVTIHSFACFLEQDDSIERFAQRDRSEKITEGKKRLQQTMKLMRKNE